MVVPGCPKRSSNLLNPGKLRRAEALGSPAFSWEPGAQGCRVTKVWAGKPGSWPGAGLALRLPPVEAPPPGRVPCVAAAPPAASPSSQCRVPSAPRRRERPQAPAMRSLLLLAPLGWLLLVPAKGDGKPEGERSAGGLDLGLPGQRPRTRRRPWLGRESREQAFGFPGVGTPGPIGEPGVGAEREWGQLRCHGDSAHGMGCLRSAGCGLRPSLPRTPFPLLAHFPVGQGGPPAWVRALAQGAQFVGPVLALGLTPVE